MEWTTAGQQSRRATGSDVRGDLLERLERDLVAIEQVQLRRVQAAHANGTGQEPAWEALRQPK
eukprot:2349633-Rhodomonas_salina.1